MAKSVSAIVNSDLLRWARKYTGLEIEYAAKKLGLEVEKLSSWESGRMRPSIAQLRHLAKVYSFPIAVFYLPNPPKLETKRPKDRRFLIDFEFEEPTPELHFEFRRVSERREITLELFSNLGISPSQFTAKTTIRRSPEKLATVVRDMLHVTIEEQFSWRDPRIAFNTWRQKLETLDVLVFQTTTVPLDQMRGFSLFYDLLPIIAVNRKDAYAARCFTLMHEMVHLMLRTESLCDMREDQGHLRESDRRIEVFCNSVAASTLVPRDLFLTNERLEYAKDFSVSGDEAIRDLSLYFSVSREVIVRRMLTLGVVDENFYRRKRAQYQKELARRPSPKGGFIHPVVDLLSSAGKPFVSLALESFNRGLITTSDVSDYLGVRLKHLERLQDSVFGT